jgi:hypothetical protein
MKLRRRNSGKKDMGLVQDIPHKSGNVKGKTRTPTACTYW